MKIPVFVSCPTVLSAKQEDSRRVILRELNSLGLEARALGRSDYPTDFPLREVLIVAKHCAGGVILGFSQFETDSGFWKRGTPEQNKSRSRVAFPSAWNQLEAGILFGLRVPLLIFREDGITGGVFDPGVSDVFVHKMPTVAMREVRDKGLTQVFLKWQAAVRSHYYELAGM
jgi:hypothetical protein